MKIRIDEVFDNNSIHGTVLAGEIKPGVYIVEDAASGTTAQNKLFHLLVAEWDKSNLATLPQPLREHVKRKLGEGFEEYLYFDGVKLVKATTREEIPAQIRNNRDLCFGRLKSWSDYTKVQRLRCIDRLISEMVKSGVVSKRFDEIIKDYRY